MFGRFHDRTASGRRVSDLLGVADQTSLVPPGLPTQPLELAARPADDIEIDPLQGRTQLRLVKVAVVVDPAANARVVHLGQVLQGLVAAMMKRPAPNCSADGRQRLMQVRLARTMHDASDPLLRSPCSVVRLLRRGLEATTP